MSTPDGSLPEVQQSQTESEQGSEPELEVTRLGRSADRVLSPENVGKSENAIVRVGKDASVVIGKGDKNLTVYSDDGEIVGLSNTNLVMADWGALASPEDGSWKLIRSVADAQIDENNILLEDLPTELRSVAQNLLGSGTSVELPQESWEIKTTDMSQVAIDNDDGYVVIYQPGTPNFIAFKTENAQGEALAVRNWQRIDTQTDDPRQIFQERAHYMQLENTRSLRHTRNGVSIIVAENGVDFRRGAQGVHAENLPNVQNNVSEDPSSPGVVYFCSENDTVIRRIDTNSSNPKSEEIPLPSEYPGIQNLTLDKTGNFLTFTSKGTFYVLEKNTLREVHEIPNIYHASLDASDIIKGIDVEGHLVTFQADFQPLVQAIRAREVAEAAQKAAEQLDPDAIATQKAAELDRQFGHLKGQRDDLAAQIKSRVEGITDLNAFNEEFDRVTQLINGMGLQPGEQDYMRPALEKVVQERRQAVVADVFSTDLTSLQELIEGSMDMSTYAQAANVLANLNSLRGDITDETVKQRLQQLEGRFQEKDKQFRREQNEHIKVTTADVLARAKQAIAAMKSKSALAVWSEEELSTFRSELGNLRVISIPENHGVIDQAQTAIFRAIKERREAIEDMEAATGTTETDLREIQINSYKEEIRSLLETMGDQGFQNRDQIARYLEGSNRYTDLQEQVIELLRSDPQAGREIRRELGVSLALYMAEVERATRSDADGDGRPMVMLGEVPFPVWQERRKSKREKEKHVELTFIPDPNAAPMRENGKTVTLGEIGVQVRNGKPDVTISRVYQGKTDEEDWRNGLVEYRGTYTEGTRVTNIEMQKIKSDYRDWQKGEGSDIRKELSAKKKAFQDFFLERPVTLPDGSEVTLSEAKSRIKGFRERGEEVPMIAVDTKKGTTIQKPYEFAEGDTATDWEQEYKRLVEEYGEFAAEKHTLLFERLDELKKAPDTDEPSSLGYVPEWKSHWTIDKQTSEYLGKMAKDATMQLELQQGIINLEGHAGTGKDVLVKMFCHETKRPYFAFDCSKWTVESDLAEDITLENGSVVKIPSAVLQAIETPGAVLYFNEINAMPEPTQIFLHSLLDEKRTLTLKTSGGKSVRALPSVLFMSSMNPNYPGTFDPQFATKSRMDYLPIDYPPLVDPENTSKFSASEALRIARGVDSLEEHTYDLDLKHNEFVKIWDKYINGEANDAPHISREQHFDLQTIQALVQFADQLRTAFKDKFSPSRATQRDRDALKISQPMTGRELAKCAYDLSVMDDTQKIGTGADPVATAKRLIEQRLLTKVSNAQELEKVTTELRTWTVQPRP